MKCDCSCVRRCCDLYARELCFVKLTRGGKVSYVFIKQERCVKRWQYELEMVSIEKREVVDSFAEVVWLKRGLSWC